MTQPLAAGGGRWVLPPVAHGTLGALAPAMPAALRRRREGEACRIPHREEPHRALRGSPEQRAAGGPGSPAAMRSGCPGTAGRTASRLPWRGGRFSGAWSVCCSRGDSRRAGEARGCLERLGAVCAQGIQTSNCDPRVLTQYGLCTSFFFRFPSVYVSSLFLKPSGDEIQNFTEKLSVLCMRSCLKSCFENACKYHPVNGLFLVFLCMQTHALNYVHSHLLLLQAETCRKLYHSY